MHGWPSITRRSEGQILVIFALSFVALVAMLGLILDGGSTFGQRRSEQSAADLAALAGANDYLLNANVTHAQAVADAVAKANNYDPALVTVNVTVTPYQPTGGEVEVDISAPHPNNFTPIVGINAWTVSVTATAVAGIPTQSTGAGPMIFSVQDFGTNGQPLGPYTQAACGATGCPFGTTNGDAPDAVNDIAWTNYGIGNVDSSQVANIISGQTVVSNTITLNQYIGQQNQGFHNTLFGDVNQYLAGTDVLVPVTTQEAADGSGGGYFQGWAIFHVVSAAAGSDKHVWGYFVSQEFAPGGDVQNCVSTCVRSFGAYVLKLVN